MLRCPRCYGIHLYQVAGGYGGWIYRCKDCGYEGALVIETDDEFKTKNNETSQ